MVETRRKSTGASAGSGAPISPIAAGPPRRRVLAAPANDNATSPGRRVLRAAVFVAIGAVLAWILHAAFG